MANFYLSSLVASPQAPWRVYGAAVLARHVNHAAAVCLLQRQQQQHMSEGGGDNDDDLVSSSSSSPSAMAHGGSRGDPYGGASRLSLDNTLSFVASLLAPPPPSPPSSSSASSSSSSPSSSTSRHVSPIGVDVGGAGDGAISHGARPFGRPQHSLPRGLTRCGNNHHRHHHHITQ